MTTGHHERLTDAEFFLLSGAALASIEQQADAWLQQDVVDLDTHRTGGLLELSFPNGSKLIINTQPPLHELWLASKAGGFHFKRVGPAWLDTRDGSDFFEVLSREASKQAAKPLRFQPI
jgi:CyaY protein